MSGNEFKNKAEIEAEEALKAVADNVEQEKKKNPQTKRAIIQIMNGEFLSKDNFVQNLPFVFFLGFLLVVLIGWGYYAETVTKKEVMLEKELGELNSEYFTLGSEFNTKRGRRQIAQRLIETGVVEGITSPRKIRVKKYVFESGR